MALKDYGLYERLMKTVPTELPSPEIPQHQFFAALREVVRDDSPITEQGLIDMYQLREEDYYLHAFMSYIKTPSEESERIDRVQILEDIHVINERDDYSFYKSKEDLLRRINL